MYISLCKELKTMISTINFHLIKACNFKCRFCFATFDDIQSKGLSKQEQFKLIKLLAESKKFKKINFAGGEPTLVPHIQELIQYAKELGFVTSIVTNGSRINMGWIKNVAPYLDILGLSVDSINDETNLISGRSEKQKVMQMDHLKEIAAACKLFRISLKINTDVSKFNHHEVLADCINQLKPFRWKILQVTRVEGQNDSQFDLVKVSDEEFQQFCQKNIQNILPDIKVIIENNEIIYGSYLMIDQLGRFYDDSNSRHNYSDKILEIGVENALQQVRVNELKFEKREGDYTLETIKIHKI